MVPGIEPSTTALLTQRSTDWAIRPSYLLMHNLLQILLSREKRKYLRSKRHMLFASWHFPSLILDPYLVLSLFFSIILLTILSYLRTFSFVLVLSFWLFHLAPFPAEQFVCPILIGSIWILFNIYLFVIFWMSCFWKSLYYLAPKYLKHITKVSKCVFQLQYF